MDIAHVTLLLRVYCLLHNLNYDAIADARNYKRIELLQKDIEAFMEAQGFTINYSDLAGWGIFPVEKVDTYE